MDEHMVSAMLAVMNLSAPEGTEWCAWRPGAGPLDRAYKIRDHWRFYLVEDGSELHDSNSGNLIWGA